jgi:hypothetical protein
MFLEKWNWASHVKNISFLPIDNFKTKKLGIF